MRASLIILLCCFSMMMCFQTAAQKQDTTSNGEELLLASELFKKSDEERRVMLLKPRFRYINKADKRRLLKVGAKPVFGQFPSRERYEQVRWNLAVAYERKARDKPFSWSIETITRFGEFNPLGYDYKIPARVSGGGRVNGTYYNSGEFFAHRFRAHITLRYYYNFRNRQDAEVTGNNLYSEYFFFRLRDVLAYTEVNDFRFTRDRQLSMHIGAKRWLARPGYVSMGWGMQRPILKKGLIDFNVEIGRRLLAVKDFVFVHKDLVIDLNIFIGLGL